MAQQTQCEIRVGTSGWHYKHWRGRFYPENLDTGEWFGFFSRHFDTVEINNTFYQLPEEKTFHSWRDQAPKDFLYCVKASRYITHVKKLKDPDDAVGNFFDRVNLLGENLGPILYQLPPNLHKDAEKLSGFLDLLPDQYEHFFEFRHSSWYDDEIFQILDGAGAGFVVHDMEGIEAPRVITGGKTYLRFHGSGDKYSGAYHPNTLRKWVRFIQDNRRNLDKAYAYFNNDIDGHAIENALRLKEYLGV